MLYIYALLSDKLLQVFKVHVAVFLSTGSGVCVCVCVSESDR